MEIRKRDVALFVFEIIIIIGLGAIGAWYEWQKFKFFTGIGR